MTTEVFRNMIYNKDSENQLSNLFMVCFDEFHFMNDPDRGTVWEESVISCPANVRILALSATMGNVDEIKGVVEFFGLSFFLSRIAFLIDFCIAVIVDIISTAVYI